MLTHSQTMWLLYGYDPKWAGAFANAAEHAAAWTRHRTELLAGYHGRRPHGWWIIESLLHRYPGFDREQAMLYELGLLTESEVAELRAPAAPQNPAA